jgi:hypothetical protein
MDCTCPIAFNQDVAQRRILQFWNFKTEISSLTNGSALARQWLVMMHPKVLYELSDGRLCRSYLEGLKLGFLTQDPAALHDPNVCVPYMNSTTHSTGS